MEANMEHEKIELTIRTSEKGWLQRLAAAYRDKEPVELIDDAAVGINPLEQTLYQMGKQAGLTARDWVGVMVALGMTVFGAWMVVAAVLDPDPTSKLWLLIGSGASLVAGGGITAIRILTRHRPPTVRFTRQGFEITWEDN